MFRNPLQTLGTGIGIEIRGEDLAATLVRSRWKGVTVVGSTVIRGFRRRPAAEWGSEYQDFLKRSGFPDLPATLALPRAEAIVRLLTLPPAARAQLSSAVRFQVDSLHPYGEDNVYFAFTPLDAPNITAVAVVIAAKTVVDSYADLFTEAGVKLRAVTVVAGAYYGASRLMKGRRPQPFLLADIHDSGFELYGESETRPFFSAAFDSRTVSLDKAISAAAAELRLPETESTPVVVCGEGQGDGLSIEDVLGVPRAVPPQFDLKREATAFVAGLAAACPRWGWRINLLPAERRSSSARWPVAATAATASVTAAVAITLWLRGPIQDRRYAGALEREVKRLEAVEREVRGLERQAEKARARRRQLESFRRRPEADLALVTEISRRLPNNVWLTMIQADESSAELAGQAESAAPLLAVVDNSGVLTGAAFATSIARNENRESFRIRAARQVGQASLPVR